MFFQVNGGVLASEYKEDYTPKHKTINYDRALNENHKVSIYISIEDDNSYSPDTK